MTSLDPFALLISSAPVLSCQQDHETHMDGDPPYVRLHLLLCRPSLWRKNRGQLEPQNFRQ